jgi:hypothetical protein
MIRDKSTDRLREVRRIIWSDFHFEPSHTHELAIKDSDAAASAGVAVYFDEDGASGARLLFVSPTNADGATLGGVSSSEALVGMDDGAPLITEISTFGVGGIEIAAAGDSVSTIDLVTPVLIDPTYEIGVRVLFTANVGTPGATDAVTWLVTYKQFDIDEVMAAAATALDTVIASCVPGETAGYKLHTTSRGIISANKFDYTAKKGGLIWNVEADVVTNYSANEPVFLALEIDYMPLRFASAPVPRDFWKDVVASA